MALGRCVGLLLAMAAGALLAGSPAALAVSLLASSDAERASGRNGK